MFDSDLGNGVDAALALALLYGLEGKGEARLVSNSTTRSNLKSAAFGDVLARFYAGPPPAAGGFGGFQRPMSPIGMAENGSLAGDTPVLKAVLEKKTAEGMPAWPHSIDKLNDTADPVALIRNALTAQNDANCLVVLAGPATNLVKADGPARRPDLISRKVKLLAMAAGAYPDGRAESASKPTWPRPNACSPSGPLRLWPWARKWAMPCRFPDRASRRISPGRRPIPLSTRIARSRPCPTTPRPRPWRRCSTRSVRMVTSSCPRPARSACWRMAARASRRGRGGRHRYLVIDPAQKEKVIQAYVELASAKPAPRQNPRFRRDQKKNAPPRRRNP